MRRSSARLFPLATVVTPNLPEAETLTGLPGAPRRHLAERLVELGAGAALVTGGHGEPAVDHLFDGRDHYELRVVRHDVRATHGAGCTHSATLAASLARGLSLPDAAAEAARAASDAVRQGLAEIGAGDGPVDVLDLKGGRMIDPGTTLATLRERRPLVHSITNYVVMNETANAVLALGALPVMAHAAEEVGEMVGLAGALVLNIGTLEEAWVDSMLVAGAAANERGVPVVLDPVGAGATRYRTDTAKRILDAVDVAVLRGNAGEVATLVGVEAEVRGVESIGADGDAAELARVAARTLGARRLGDGACRPRLRRRADDFGRERPRAARRRHRHGVHVDRAHGLLPGREGRRARGCGGGARRLRRRGRGCRRRRANGPGSFHVALYDALAALDPATLTGRAKLVA